MTAILRCATLLPGHLEKRVTEMLLMCLAFSISSYIPVVSGRIGSMLLDLGLAGGIEGGLL